MFKEGKISSQKIAGYYLLLLLTAIGIWLGFYDSLNHFLKSDLVNSTIFILAIIGLFYVATITKLKDILLVKMFDTAKYDNIYEQANMRKHGQAKSMGEECYLNKYGPLNHLVDMVRACGWTMILLYLLFITLRYIGNGSVLDIISLFVLVLSGLSALVSTYFIYKNISVLCRFKK